MEKHIVDTVGQKNLNLGMHDAVVNGEVQMDIPTRLVFAADETERDALDDILPGQFVALYGLTAMWQRTGSAETPWAVVLDRRSDDNE